MLGECCLDPLGVWVRGQLAPPVVSLRVLEESSDASAGSVGSLHRVIDPQGQVEVIVGLLVPEKKSERLQINSTCAKIQIDGCPLDFKCWH